MFLDEKIRKRILEKKKMLDKHRPFPKLILERLHEQTIIEWTYNSNAIEGNTLTLKETALILRQGITIKGKSLREHYEAKNHEKAIKCLEDLVKKRAILDEDALLTIHKLILTDIDGEFAGIYRNQSVRILGARLIPPSPLKVPLKMKEFYRWLKYNPEKLDVIEFSALAHYKLVEIHPFIDGNGRTARLMMNLFLMQKGFPPAIILKNDRKKYYDALNKANMGDFEAFVLVVAQAVERSLGLYLEAIEPKTKASDEDKEYILLSEAAKHCQYSQDYLSLLARRGKLHAIKKGRNWLTTIEAVENYIEEVL